MICTMLVGRKMTGQIYDMELITEEQVQYKYDYLVLAPNIRKEVDICS